MICGHRIAERLGEVADGDARLDRDRPGRLDDLARLLRRGAPLRGRAACRRSWRGRAAPVSITTRRLRRRTRRALAGPIGRFGRLSGLVSHRRQCRGARGPVRADDRASQGAVEGTPRRRPARSTRAGGRCRRRGRRRAATAQGSVRRDEAQQLGLRRLPPAAGTHGPDAVPLRWLTRQRCPPRASGDPPLRPPPCRGRAAPPRPRAPARTPGRPARRRPPASCSASSWCAGTPQ